MVADTGVTIGSTLLAIRDDLEAAVQINRDLGFAAMEVHGSHLGAGLPNVPVVDAHAAATGDLIRDQGMIVSTLNVAGDPSFNPFSGSQEKQATVEGLARHMRWADAMGAPRVLFWDGMIDDIADVDRACTTLREVIEAARDASGLAHPPELTCELHPFTFALKHRVIEELGAALTAAGAGLCFDFAHFGVALKEDLVSHLTPDVIAATNLLHFSDTDYISSEVHFPPTEGKIDFDEIGRLYQGRNIPVAWDLFSWPAARKAVRTHMDFYKTFLDRVSGN
ncbi:MAG: TIM barrel protein [Celeribacter sp.]|jgi:sugar phosphate isomerase/epimerase